MTKYLLFCYDHYYPEGGWNDLVGIFDTEIEAKNKALKINMDGHHIIKLQFGFEKEYTNFERI